MSEKKVTPIRDFVRRYADSPVLRLHMPGHKGRGDEGSERYDITEISGADSLYCPNGIIKESEECLSDIFGARSFYSAEGSSLSIRAMLYLALLRARDEGKSPLFIAARNAHSSFITGAALLDARVVWLYPEDGCGYLDGCVEPSSVASALESHPDAAAVYITTPDYLGGMADVEAIARVCRERGVPLLVDNAHGAYLKFLEKSLHPIDLGADMCADSAHKTLPVLTGGAYLHVSRSAPAIFADTAKAAMSLFGSTSPSYLILSSLDGVNASLASDYRARLREFCSTVSRFRCELRSFGYTIVSKEPLKITLAAKSVGYSGYELSELLRNRGVECEFADPDYTVLMLTPSMSGEDIAALGRALTSVEKRDPIVTLPPAMPRAVSAMSVREAVMSPAEQIPVSRSVGRILSAPTVSCPPAVPILVSGEVVSPEFTELFAYYGIDKIRVVKS